MEKVYITLNTDDILNITELMNNCGNDIESCAQRVRKGLGFGEEQEHISRNNNPKLTREQSTSNLVDIDVYILKV